MVVQNHMLFRLTASLGGVVPVKRASVVGGKVTSDELVQASTNIRGALPSFVDVASSAAEVTARRRRKASNQACVLYTVRCARGQRRKPRGTPKIACVHARAQSHSDKHLC